MRLRLSKPYAASALALFAIEVGIALGVHDRFVRPFVGDALVVALLYAALLSVAELPRAAAVGSVWVFACLIEIGQHFDLVTRLHLEHSALARLVIGTTYAASDFIAYTAGALLVLAVESRAQKRRPRKRRAPSAVNH